AIQKGKQRPVVARLPSTGRWTACAPPPTRAGGGGGGVPLTWGRANPARPGVLDGELIAFQPDGRPHPFQVTAGRLGSKLDMERQRLAVPLTLYLFDALHVDGEDLIDRGGGGRHAP